MIRLKKWNYDEAERLYRNVISGREISEAEWKEMGAKIGIANLGGRSGDSLTSSFTRPSGVSSLS